MWVIYPGKDLKKKVLSNGVKEAPCTDQQFICQENIGVNDVNVST